MRHNLFSALLLAGVLLGGCGSKGDPVAPLTAPPDNTRDLRARLLCNAVELDFTVAGKRTDGLPLSGALQAEIYRRGAVTSPPVALDANAPDPNSDANDPSLREAATPAPTPQEFVKLDVMAVPTPPIRYVDEGKASPLSVGSAYEYQVVLVDEDGETSAPSNTARVEFALPAAPPSGLTARPTAEGVSLAWTPPSTDCSGAVLSLQPMYQVYRRQAKDPNFPEAPLNSAPVSEARFLDGSAIADQSYAYLVRAELRPPRRESANSAVIAVDFPDVYPPEPPTGLVISRVKEGVQLLWNPSPSADVAGYFVYRASSGQELRLTSAPSPQTSFLDKDVALGRVYRYRVTAVDKSSRANESTSTKMVSLDAR